MEHIPALAADPDDRDAPRRSLILAGRGMRVAWQAGVLCALEESGLAFAHADGTSGGTINLAMLLSGRAPREMSERWRTLRVRDFASPLPLREYLRGPRLSGFAGADGIVRRVFPHLGIDVETIRSARGIEGTFNVCNHAAKTNEAIGHRDVDLEALVAGISLPMIMPAVWRGRTPYVDAVWIKDANLMGAVKRGAEELWILWCIGNTPAYRDGPFHQYVHMIEQSANGALFEKLDRIGDLNAAIRAGTLAVRAAPPGDRSRRQAAPPDPARSGPLSGADRRGDVGCDGLPGRSPIPRHHGRRPRRRADTRGDEDGGAGRPGLLARAARRSPRPRPASRRGTGRGGVRCAPG